MKKIKLYSYSLITLLCLLLLGDQIYVYSLRKTAQVDLDFIHATILENHPGPYSNQDPEFVPSMNNAHQVAQESIKSVRATSGFIQIIKTYLQSFHDSHVRFYQPSTACNATNIQPHKPLTIKNLPGNIVWVTLPTFMPNKSQQHGLNSIINQIHQHQTAQVIVFDVRGNTGGNSHWGTMILQNLFGKSYTDHCLYNMNKKIKVDWRASKDNADYLKDLTRSIADQFGIDSAAYEEFKAIEYGMQEAHDQNIPLFTQHTDKLQLPTPPTPNPVTAQIIIIIDGYCVSACLDFIDEVKALNPSTILIGQTTTADSIYMDIRTIDLPSQIGKLQFPIKVYRNRPRGHNVPYTPDIPYPVKAQSHEQKDAWLLETINALTF